jgi:cytochrome o ubiquinol oxidase subunit 2
MTAWFAWHYRAGNERATYMPKWESVGLDVVVWLVPAVIVLILGVLTWNYTHSLNPYKPLPADAKPLKVQVVALDWKWLFIYPEQGVASVNQLVIPTGRPVNFDITADTVMNSFFIPQLGGQIYAMAGMRTKLNLQADRPGTFFGENTQYSGRGFPFQSFEVQAKPQKGFDAWVHKVKRQDKDLDWSRYQALEKPSMRDPVRHYATVDHGLFQRIMAKYMPDKAPAAMQPAS